MGQLRLQSSYLQQFLQPREPPKGGLPSAPAEFAAGLPLDAAEALLLLGPQGGPPWRGLPAPLACAAAAVRLFARLLPAHFPEDACERLCQRLAMGAEAAPVGDALAAAALTAGLSARPVNEPVECLQAMVRGKPVGCCAVLEDYVGVLEEAETGEEVEEEVGKHAVLVVGGDLSGPSYVVFDPYGAKGGELLHWSAHDLEKAAPSAWVELSPALLQQQDSEMN